MDVLSKNSQVVCPSEPNRELESNRQFGPNQQLQPNHQGELNQQLQLEHQCEPNQQLQQNQDEQNEEQQNEEHRNVETRNEEEQWFEYLNIPAKIQCSLKSTSQTLDDRKFVNLLVDSAGTESLSSLFSNKTDKKLKLKSDFRKLKEYSIMKGKFKQSLSDIYHCTKYLMFVFCFENRIIQEAFKAIRRPIEQTA